MSYSRFVINWRFRIDFHDPDTEAIGGQFSVLAPDVHHAMELGFTDAWAQLDQVQAMIPASSGLLVSICQPGTMDVLAHSWRDWIGMELETVTGD